MLQFGACLVLGTTAGCEHTKTALATLTSDATNAGVDGTDGSQDGLGPNQRPSPPPPPPLNPFAGIDTVVVLMMENRSFDHVFGMLHLDPSYPCRQDVESLRGNESNPTPDGKAVTSVHLTSLIQADPLHSWEASHAAWNHGLNNGFVSSTQPYNQQEVMGYLLRDQMPFTYWLADNYTLCDHWHAAVLGPTWPNRAVLHATTADGIQSNAPFANPPKTVWDGLTLVGRTGKNYFAGSTSCYAGLFAQKVRDGVNPTAPLDDFFTAAQSGTLPSFSMIDPDYQLNDDHPPHDLRLGQALIASVYHALVASPQWPSCLFIINYDEHGGFFDHVPPPPSNDTDPLFAQVGFRVPALVIGPTVRRGSLCSTVLEHSSVAATLKSCFGIETLTPRMAAANDLSSCIDPAAIGSPRPPPSNPPVVAVPPASRLLMEPPARAQADVVSMVRSGKIAAEAVDSRTREERLTSWLQTAHRLGAIKFEKT